MSHPGPLLTDYVDGTLGPEPRAEVESHLQGCATCREEVRLARAGKRAAAAVPSPAVPPDLAEQAIDEARRVARERSPEVAAISSAERRRPNAPRWLAAATAAAAVIIAVALIGPKLGQSQGSVAEQAAGAAGGARALPSPTAVEIQRQNYTFGGLSTTTQALRSTYASFAADAEAGAVTAPASTLTNAPPTDHTSKFSIDRLAPATNCLTRAFVHTEGQLVRVILARYEGQPAYFGVYLVSPGAGLAPNELRLDVASVQGCTILAESSAKI